MLGRVCSSTVSVWTVSHSAFGPRFGLDKSLGTRTFQRSLRRTRDGLRQVDWLSTDVLALHSKAEAGRQMGKHPRNVEQQVVQEGEVEGSGRGGRVKKRLEVDGLPIEGISIGGHETCIMLPSMKVAFDIGRCPQRAISQDFLLISHAHMDHIVRHRPSLIYVSRELLSRILFACSG